VTNRARSRPALTDLAADLDELLAVSDAQLATGYPGEYRASQPAHTAYVPAHRFDKDTVRVWGGQAVAALEEFAPDAAGFATAFGVSVEMAEQVRPLVLAKLESQPIEDLRIDFEDGYGTRSDDTEDAHARAAGRALFAVLGEDAGPSLVGIRCKSLDSSTRRRAIATIGAFLGAFLDNGVKSQFSFVITLPKVTSVAHVTAMNVLCERFESAYGLTRPHLLGFEIQVETPQLILGADGAATIAKCVHAGRERLRGLHYGTYDYSAAVGISSAYQSLDHPAADYAKAVMQVAAAGTGVRLSDGSSNVLPVGTRAEVISAWQLHARLVRRSLERGFYQGWDLHPAQLVSRYAATYAFYRDGFRVACRRLRDYAERAATGIEEPATAKALAGYLDRAVDCGAASLAEITALTGLSRGDLMHVRRRGSVPSWLTSLSAAEEC
jgi:citrate lyase beta subunit